MMTNKHHSIYPRGLVFAVIVGDEEFLSTQVGVYVLVGKHDTHLTIIYRATRISIRHYLHINHFQHLPHR
jgi:hypothetical protein